MSGRAVIDAHTHYFPTPYLKWLEEVSSSDGPDGAQRIARECLKRVSTNRGMSDIDARLVEMDTADIGTEVLSVGNLDVALAGDQSADLARRVNDSLASIADAHPNRFLFMGCVALNDVEAACAELYRIMQLDTSVGVMLPTHVADVPLDHQGFGSFFQVAADLGAVIALHPTLPRCSGPEELEYGLMPLIGFIADTAYAVMRLIMGGIFERHGNLKVVVPHMGGMLLYMAHRIDSGWSTNRDSQSLPLPPSSYLRKFFYDSVNVSPANLRCAIDTVGIENLVVGTDYPFFSGRDNVSATMSALVELGHSESDIGKLARGNAQRLFGLPTL